MRLFVNLALIFVLATCPFWCATAEATFGWHHGHGCHHTDSGFPATSPTNDDDCVCNGGLKADQTLIQLTDLQPGDLPLPCAALLPLSLFPPSVLLGWPSGPWEPVVPRHGASLRAQLQNFRC
ncbi:MAG: hypothetical protein IRY99_11710 [Isosphaeraceae bacterium]|nr:hypothetical protein [Isosphaeraceae bacterium]